MTAAILDMAEWRARLRPVLVLVEPELPPDLERAIRLAGIAYEGACRTAARLNRLGRHDDALNELNRCRADIRALSQAFPHIQITGMLQDLSGKALQVRRLIKQRAKR